jgi:EmrB/QacA subfamily drug resistance transporter
MTAAARARVGGGARRATGARPRNRPRVTNPWNALWAMMVGFFMILVDATIVAVANPSIMVRLDTGYDTVIWVTSAYLLAYAVPLLVAGRLGDRFGPKNLYLIGLAVFTAASLWCGLAGSIGMLIAARVVQGIGAAVLTPQTLSMITRIFPPERRGAAMSVWGATAGVATLVGPLAGGVLVDGLGWEWIFFVNVPIGLIGLALAAWLVPVLSTQNHRFDLAGVGLSGAGMFLIVFGLQQGQAGGWAPWIWAVIVAGIGFVAMFGYWQAINTREPLVPLGIFRVRDFSVANLGVAVIGFAATAMILPLMFFAQSVCGLSPTRSALLTAPMAIVSGLLAPMVGKIVDNYHPRSVVGFGFSVLAIALTWLSIEMTPSAPIWRLLVPLAAMGVGMAFVWSPLAATATRNLPPDLAGAGSGVYNATRQVGAVLGSAGMAAFMTSRIIAEMPELPDGVSAQEPQRTTLQLPQFLREPFAAAMSQSMLLPAFVSLFGVAAALFMVGFAASGDIGERGHVGDRIDGTTARPDDDVFGDDYDDYVEYTIARGPEPSRAPISGPPPAGRDDADDTAPLDARPAHLRTASAEALHRDAVRPGRRVLDAPEPSLEDEQIGFAHNGFHVDDQQRFRPLAEFVPPSTNRRGGWGGAHFRADDLVAEDSWSDIGRGSSARHQRREDEPPRNRHYRDDLDDPPTYGRHWFPQRD